MPPGRVFISYRREDTSATAGRLYDRLVAQFGSGNVFMDVDSITPGYDFANAIESAVASCQVVLAVIGKGWLDASDERGRRLDDPDDFVVLEIKAGLDREIPVIPVLVGGVPVPRRDELPTALSALARRQSLRLDHDSFNADFARLATALEQTFPLEDTIPRPVAHEAPAPPRRRSDEAIPPPSRLLGTLKGSNRFYATAFSSDMQMIAGAGARGTLLWESHSYKCVRTIGPQTKPTIAVAFGLDDGVLATAMWGDAVRLWDPTSGAELNVLKGHAGVVTTVAFSPDGLLLATGSDDHSARLWDPRSGDLLQVLDGHDEGVTAVAFSPDGHLLATSSHDGTVRLWDSSTGRTVHTVIGHTKGVSTLAFDPVEGRLATAGRDKTVHVWDPVTAADTVLIGDAGGVTSLAYRPDGRVLAAGCTDNTVRLWDPTTGGALGRFHGHRGVLFRNINGVTFSPDGRTLASAGEDGNLRLWV